MDNRGAPSPTPVGIHTEAIELAAFLKWAGLVATGGQAKQLIEDGQVRVNGTVERRRGRHLVGGDVVECGNRALTVAVTS
jgi:ribosome-associated protein